VPRSASAVHFEMNTTHRRCRDVLGLLGSRCHCGEAAIEKAPRRVGGAKVEPPQCMGKEAGLSIEL
jgi:hypothetical protein